MATQLVYPPFVSGVSGPPVGLAALGAYLGAHGQTVRSHDLNLAYFWYLWSHWERFDGQLRSRLRSAELGGGVTAAQRRRLLEACGVAGSIRARFLRRGWSVSSRCKAPDPQSFRVLQRLFTELSGYLLLDDLSAYSDPLRLSFAEVHDACRCSHSTLWDAFLAPYHLGDTRCLGISVLSESQFSYAVLMAQGLRSAGAETTIALGGAYVTEMASSLCASEGVFDVFDYLVCHEGESALLAIASAGRGARIRHPNVLTREDCERRTAFHVEDIARLPAPDFRAFQLDDYKAWGLRVPVYSSKGCSWGRCRFCSTNFLVYRERPVDSFLADVRAIRQTHQVEAFQLADEDVTPSRLRAFAEQGFGGEGATWILQTRFYRQLDLDLLQRLKQTGLETIEFGLESASPRVLRHIRKGIDLGNVERILQDCQRSGIAVVLNMIIGFPGETEEDAELSAQFIASLASRYPTLRFHANTQTAQVYLHSDFHAQADAYGCQATRYPLSPRTAWPGPSWLPVFLRRHREHPLFATTVDASALPAGKVQENPKLSLANEWYFVPSFGGISGNDSLLRLREHRCQQYRTNEVMTAVVSLLETPTSLGELRQEFCTLVPAEERSMAATRFGEALVFLNAQGALAIDEA